MPPDHYSSGWRPRPVGLRPTLFLILCLELLLTPQKGFHLRRPDLALRRVLPDPSPETDPALASFPASGHWTSPDSGSPGIEVAARPCGSHAAPALPSEAAEPTYQMLQNVFTLAAPLCKFVARLECSTLDCRMNLQN
ncbi:uncharacterized protein LOC144224506 isoform X2 [Crocuta crocuta]